MLITLLLSQKISKLCLAEGERGREDINSVLNL